MSAAALGFVSVVTLSALVEREVLRSTFMVEEKHTGWWAELEKQGLHQAAHILDQRGKGRNV